MAVPRGGTRQTGGSWWDPAVVAWGPGVTPLLGIGAGQQLGRTVCRWKSGSASSSNFASLRYTTQVVSSFCALSS